MQCDLSRLDCRRALSQPVYNVASAYATSVHHVAIEYTEIYIFSWAEARVLTRLLQRLVVVPVRDWRTKNTFKSYSGGVTHWKSINLRSEKLFFLQIAFLTLSYLRIILTYLLRFWRISKGVSWPQKLFLLTYWFSPFPNSLTYLLLFWRLSDWFDLKNVFLHFTYLALFRIFLLTH